MNEQKTTSELMKEGYNSEHSTPFSRPELRQGLFRELENLYRILGNCEVYQTRSQGDVVTVPCAAFNEIVEVVKKRCQAVNFRLTKSFDVKGM